MLLPHLHELEQETDRETLFFLIGVSSESDGLPLGAADAYEKKVGPLIIAAATKLLMQFSSGQ